MMAESEEEEKDATVLRWCIGPVATDGDCYWKRVDRNNSPKSVGYNIQSDEHHDQKLAKTRRTGAGLG
jgi:hypothetical protein